MEGTDPVTCRRTTRAPQVILMIQFVSSRRDLKKLFMYLYSDVLSLNL